MNIIAYHGWACEGADWNDWKALIPSDYTFETWDRGYFGNATSPTKMEYDIVITHSMGLFQVPVDLLNKARMIVALHPFIYFPSNDEDTALRVIHQLDRMCRNMISRPLEQIQLFRNQVGLTDLECELNGVNTNLLIEDLKRLKTEKLNTRLFHTLPQVVWIHEDQDSIVTSQCRKELEMIFPHQEQLALGQGTHSYSLKYPLSIISRLF